MDLPERALIAGGRVVADNLELHGCWYRLRRRWIRRQHHGPHVPAATARNQERRDVVVVPETADVDELDPRHVRCRDIEVHGGRPDAHREVQAANIFR